MIGSTVKTDPMNRQEGSKEKRERTNKRNETREDQSWKSEK